jgi:hypothetical protein
VLGPGRVTVGWPIVPIRIRKEIRLDQLEEFDQLEIWLDLCQLERGLDMI